MRGNVIGFDPDTNTGAISGHDGNRYDFVMTDWRGGNRPRHGDVVDFQATGQRAVDIYLIAPEYVAPSFGQFYFSASGRVSRKQYWLKLVVPVIAISVALQIIIGISALAGSFAALGVFYIVYVLFGLAVLWPSIAVLIKRIHDRDKTGWLVLLPYVPLVLMAAFSGIGAAAGGGAVAMGAIAIVFFIAFFAIAVWFFVEFGCLRGTIGANQYGPDPVR
jgi:uncharacterized membrane protein YhaH (DUF805 family)